MYRISMDVLCGITHYPSTREEEEEKTKKRFHRHSFILFDSSNRIGQSPTKWIECRPSLALALAQHSTKTKCKQKPYNAVVNAINSRLPVRSVGRSVVHSQHTQKHTREGHLSLSLCFNSPPSTFIIYILRLLVHRTQECWLVKCWGSEKQHTDSRMQNIRVRFYIMYVCVYVRISILYFIEMRI